jgi:hypothetical protein
MIINNILDINLKFCLYIIIAVTNSKFFCPHKKPLAAMDSGQCGTCAFQKSNALILTYALFYDEDTAGLAAIIR